MAKDGFTLLETLLVLFIMASILLVSQSVTLRLSEQFIDERVLEQFKYDMLLTQVRAMHAKEKAQLEIDDYNTYKINAPLHHTRRILPTGAAIYHRSNTGRVVEFTATGNTNASGAFYYEGLHRDYKLVIQLGRGRINIEPQ